VKIVTEKYHCGCKKQKKTDAHLQAACLKIRSHTMNMDQNCSNIFALPCFGIYHHQLNQHFLLNYQEDIECKRPKFNEMFQKQRVDCPVCSRTLFNTSLKYHLQLHELKKSERNFKCDKCVQKFFTKKCLMQHDKIHSKPFMCEFCPHKFAYRHFFSQHLLKKHPRHYLGNV
jgi:hypothetical protein